MTKSQVAWLASTIAAIIVLAVGLTLSADSEDSDHQALEIVLEEGESRSVDVDPAGTVTLVRTRSHLRIEAAEANPGFSSQIRVADGSGQHVRADFTGGGKRFSFSALLYEGRVRITIDQESLSAIAARSGATQTPLVVDTTSSTVTTSTTAATTIPTTSTSSTTTAPPTTAAPPTTVPPTTTTVAPTTTAAPTTTVAPTTTAPPASTTTLAPLLPDGDVTYPLGPAGTAVVTFQGGEFVEVDLHLARHWEVDQAQGDEDRIDLVLVGRDQRVIWQARIQDGVVVISLEVRDDAA